MSALSEMAAELSEGYGQTETKKIIALCMDKDEAVYPVTVEYDVTDNYVKVIEVTKLDRDYIDLVYEIMEAIRNEEGQKVTIEFEQSKKS